MHDGAQAPAHPWAGRERRNNPRKRKSFFIAYTMDELSFVPAYGLDVSRTGVRILTDVQMPPRDFRLRLMFKERDFLVGVTKVWETETPRDDKIWYTAGARFEVIGKNDREFLACWIVDRPYYEGSNQKLLDMLEELRKHPDNVERILPLELLMRFHKLLVARHRLVLEEHKSPLVKYRYDGPRDRAGKRVHVMTIWSKVVGKAETESFTTRFAFDDAAKKIEVLD